MINTAYIFEAIRTPRGKGKKEGALHEVKQVHPAAGLLREMQGRHNLDTSCVDDVVLGCVSPVGEQGGDIAKTVAQVAGWCSSTAFALPAWRL
jgi:acetyl-CoA C-acetyltransferase